MFNKPEFPVLLFIGGLLVFAWPLMEVARALPPGGRILYFFGFWLLIIFFNILLFRKPDRF